MDVNINEVARQRVYAGYLLLKGKRPKDVAAIVGVARQTVYRWRRVLLDHGIDTLGEKRKPGPPSLISSEQIVLLQQMLAAGPRANGNDVDCWSITRVRLLIERHFGVRYTNANVRRILGSASFQGKGFTAGKDEAAVGPKRIWIAGAKVA